MRVLKTQTLPTYTLEQFYSYWDKNKTIDSVKKSDILRLFRPYIQALQRLAQSQYYWQIFENTQPNPKILFAGGAVSQLTPVKQKELIKISPDTFFTFFHPEDKTAVFSFLVKMHEILSNKSMKERERFTFCIYLRIKNKTGEYLWNCMQYPSIFFDEFNNIKLAMVTYTNVHNLSTALTQPMLTILEQISEDKQELTTIFAQNESTLTLPKLSKREKEILHFLSKGKSSKQISAILGIAKSTVDNHRQRLLKKFEVLSSAQLIAKYTLGEIGLK